MARVQSPAREHFLLVTAFRLACGPPSLLSIGYQGLSSTEIKRTGRDGLPLDFL
jgi:hypothetical protein